MNCGDGSANLQWFLSMENAEKSQEAQYEGWAEVCVGRVETFVGSNVHISAVKTEEEAAYYD